jgi:hypothetical protein
MKRAKPSAYIVPPRGGSPISIEKRLFFEKKYFCKVYLHVFDDHFHQLFRSDAHHHVDDDPFGEREKAVDRGEYRQLHHGISDLGIFVLVHPDGL